MQLLLPSEDYSSLLPNPEAFKALEQLSQKPVAVVSVVESKAAERAFYDNAGAVGRPQNTTSTTGSLNNFYAGSCTTANTTSKTDLLKSLFQEHSSSTSSSSGATGAGVGGTSTHGGAVFPGAVVPSPSAANVGNNKNKNTTALSPVVNKNSYKATAGIWAYARPHPRNPNLTIVYLDVEGIATTTTTSTSTNVKNTTDEQDKNRGGEVLAPPPACCGNTTYSWLLCALTLLLSDVCILKTCGSVESSFLPLPDASEDDAELKARQAHQKFLETADAELLEILLRVTRQLQRGSPFLQQQTSTSACSPAGAHVLGGHQH
ncbi:unnamed protein product, partial [Amoebophrya sp. A120]|eukprot:GSA120T00004689001.1